MDGATLMRRGFVLSLCAIAVLVVPVPWSAAEDTTAGDLQAIELLRDEVRTAGILERLGKPPSPDVISIRNVQVVDPVAGTVKPGQSVIVTDGRIAAVGDVAREPRVEGAFVVDGGGRYLSPGLVDMHVHSSSASAWLLDLAYGVTSVREMAGFPWLLDVRTHVRDARMLGPTLYVAGTILNQYPLWGYAVTPDGALDARRIVRQQAACGYDFVKVHNILSRPVLDAVAEEARRVGLDLVGHVPHDISVRYAVEHGMRTMEHLKGFINDATLEMGDTDYAAAARPDVWVTPTLYVGRQFASADARREFLERPEMRYVPRRKLEDWRGAVAAPPDEPFRIAMQGEVYRRGIVKSLAQQKGVRFLAGTDAAGYPFTVMGAALVEELRLLEQNGLAPTVVLRAATTEPADAMRVADEVGRIERGLRADLVLLDGNPLEDPNVFGKNAGVMVRGRWLARADLDRALDELARIQAAAEPPEPITAASAGALAREVAALAESGFVFNPGILADAAAALGRAGHADAGRAIAALSHTPVDGPCAVPSR
jgi:imidazolonepropionase-like amidohydrolase